MATRRGVFYRLRELIGSVRRLSFQFQTPWSAFPTLDVSRSDYGYYDKLRRCKVKGMELAGLFAKPLASKVASWVMGVSPEWRFEQTKTNDLMRQWWMRHHADVLRGYEEAINLGDCYLVINADLSVTVVPPHVISPIVAADDFSVIMGWRIREEYPNPADSTQKMWITDEYTLKQRVRIVEIGTTQISRKVYRNVIGVLPVVHIKNLFGVDEMFGRPEVEPLLPSFQRYNDVFETALKGNIRQGRPTPVISKMGSAATVKAFWEKFGKKETVEHPDGTSTDVDVIPFDPDQLMTLGGEAEFSYQSPGSFSEDTEKLLAILFYLIVQNSEIPEFVWGTAISASKASAESQVEPFIKWLEKKRSRAHAWLMEVAQVVLAYLSVLEPGVNKEELPTIQWKPLTSQDGRLTLDTIIWGWSKNLIDDETAVALLPINVADPIGMLRRAKAEPPKQAAWDDSEASRAAA